MSSLGYDIKSKGTVHSLSFEVAGKKISFETGHTPLTQSMPYYDSTQRNEMAFTVQYHLGKIGRQAAGSVVARTGDTMVYSTVCIEREAQPVDFTPLRVDYFARYR